MDYDDDTEFSIKNLCHCNCFDDLIKLNFKVYIKSKYNYIQYKSENDLNIFYYECFDRYNILKPKNVLDIYYDFKYPEDIVKFPDYLDSDDESFCVDLIKWI